MGKELLKSIEHELGDAFCLKCEGKLEVTEIVEIRDSEVETMIHCPECKSENTAIFHLIFLSGEDEVASESAQL